MGNLTESEITLSISMMSDFISYLNEPISSEEKYNNPRAGAKITPKTGF